jgi:hypothetical protein
MDGKVFYGTSAGVFVVSFGVTMTVLEVLKPEFVVEKKSSFMEDEKKVDHVKAALYSTAIAIAATAVAVVIMNMFAKEKMGPGFHTTTVIVAAFTVTATVLMIVNPEFLRVDKKPENDMVKTSMLSLIVAIVVGIIDYFIYKQVSRGSFSAPSASCFPEMGFGKSHYKMSFPKSSCSMASE